MQEHDHQGRGRRDWRAQAARRGAPTTTEADRSAIRAWFIGQLVDDWFVGEPELVVDDYEILVVGELAPIDGSFEDAAAHATAESARIDRFRNDTRDRRIELAARAERQFERKVSWGAKVGSTSQLFTTASVPMMTRLRLLQRQTLDTLVESGVARSRSEALAWCVELVRRNEEVWIEKLRSAVDTVEQARAEGPSTTSS